MKSRWVSKDWDLASSAVFALTTCFNDQRMDSSWKYYRLSQEPLDQTWVCLYSFCCIFHTDVKYGHDIKQVWNFWKFSAKHRPNIGLFVLIVMHFPCWRQIMDMILNNSAELSEHFLNKNSGVVCTQQPHVWRELRVSLILYCIDL